MAIFEEVGFTWEGREYKIPPDQVMRVIAQVEGEITLGELARAAVSGNVPLARVASAYAVLLRAAGARVKAEEVYAAIFGDSDMVRKALDAIALLQMLMIPPEQLRKRQEGTAAKKSDPESAPPAE